VPRKKRKSGVRVAKNENEKAGKRATPRPFWSGTLSFGLVSIPVELYPAQRSARVSLRLLDHSGTPLARRYYCPEDGSEVDNADLVRGYELDSGEYVVITDEELEALDPKKSRDIDLRRFVDDQSLDPLYFERAYFLSPGAESSKAYRLLAEIMERNHRVGIATFVLRDKEYVIAISSQNGFLRAQTLRFHDEVRGSDAIGLPDKHKPARNLVQRIEKAIDAAAEDSFDPDELRDDSADRLRELAEKKQRSGEDLVQAKDVEEAPSADVVDLMAVLKRSLRAHEAAPAAGRPSARKPARPTKRRKKAS
jgi:DNA end-binding protein Ku